jgi:hypothetical protein
LTTIEIETKMNALDVKEMGIGNGKKGVSWICDRRSVGQWVSVFWLPSGTYGQILLFCLTVVGFVMLITLSDERMGL